MAIKIEGKVHNPRIHQSPKLCLCGEWTHETDASKPIMSTCERCGHKYVLVHPDGWAEWGQHSGNHEPGETPDPKGGVPFAGRA